MLALAANYGRTKVVHALITAGARDERGTGKFAKSTALMAACSAGRVEIVRILLRTGQPPSAVDVKSESGVTALICAAGWSDKLYLEGNSEEGPPMSECDRLECIKLLLEASDDNYAMGSMVGRSAFQVQHGRAALAVARLLGLSEVEARLVAAFTEEAARTTVSKTFQVNMLDEHCTSLEIDLMKQLEGNFKDGAMDDQMRKALVESFDKHAQNMKQWQTFLEKEAAKLW